MGRAMVREPKVFLFDEPLSNLDAQLRVRMRGQYFCLLHQRLKSTVVLRHPRSGRGHDAGRSQFLVFMNGGQIEQLGTPLELYLNPLATQFVATFIGTPSR